MTYFYTGEVDQDGKACGYGSAYNQVDSDWEVDLSKFKLKQKEKNVLILKKHMKELFLMTSRTESVNHFSKFYLPF